MRSRELRRDANFYVAEALGKTARFPGSEDGCGGGRVPARGSVGRYVGQGWVSGCGL